MACKNKIKKSTLPFAEINLQRMVNSEISWAGRIDLCWISSSISHSFPHGSKIHHCWNSTDEQKNKIVKHHETLTHWSAQTSFSFYPSLEVAISYFRKYTCYSLKFKGLEEFLKSPELEWATAYLKARYQRRTWDHLKDNHASFVPCFASQVWWYFSTEAIFRYSSQQNLAMQVKLVLSI